jgi:hypothetical protein
VNVDNFELYEGGGDLAKIDNFELYEGGGGGLVKVDKFELYKIFTRNFTKKFHKILQI